MHSIPAHLSLKSTPLSLPPSLPWHAHTIPHVLAVTHAQCCQERRRWSTAISQKGGSSGRKEKSQSTSKTKGKEDGRRRGTNRRAGTGTRKDRPERFVKSGKPGRRREEKRGGEKQETRSLSAAAVRVAAWAMHHPKACQPYFNAYLYSWYFCDMGLCALRLASNVALTVCY